MNPTREDLSRDLRGAMVRCEEAMGDDVPIEVYLATADDVLSEIAPAAIRRALAAEAEVARLRADLAAAQSVASGLAARVAAQSELLSKRAEK